MRGLVIALSVTAGCGTEVIETAPPNFEPLCGGDGPVELLALEDHEQVGWVDSLGPEAELLVSTIAVGTDGLPAHDPPRTVQHVLVDRCGETVVPAPPNVYFMHRWDDVLLACARDGVVQLDDASDTNPRLLVRNACFMPATSAGRVALDVDFETLTGRLVTLTKSGTEVTVSTLLEGVHVSADPISRHTPIVIDDRVLVMMSDLRLVSVDASTGDSRVEVEAVSEFSATSDAVLYRPPTTDRDAASPVWLRDRSTGTDELVDAALPGSWGIGLSMERGLIVLRRGGVNPAGRWFETRPVRELVPPEGTEIVEVRGDGLVWLRRTESETHELELLRWREGESAETAMRCSDCVEVGGWSDTAMDVLELTARLDRHILWRIDDEGGPPREIGTVGNNWLPTPSGGVMTVLESGGAGSGRMVLYDDEGSEGVVIGDEVHWRSLMWTYGVRPEEEILYESRDGDRHVLHRALVAR